MRFVSISVTNPFLGFAHFVFQNSRAQSLFWTFLADISGIIKMPGIHPFHTIS
jgi:hypothetical protein